MSKDPLEEAVERPLRRRSARPKQWKPWHEQIVGLAAQGYGAHAIANRLGVNQGAVDYALTVPAVKRAIQIARDVVAQQLGKVLAKQLMHDTPRNLAFLQQVRDGELAPDAKGEIAAWRDRVAAANRLLDSQIPRVTVSRQQHSGVVGMQHLFSADEAAELQALAVSAAITLPALPEPDGET